MKVLYDYPEIKVEIEMIENDILYYEQLLQQEDLSELEYCRQKEYRGIRYIDVIFSEVEKQVIKRETAHKMNHHIIRQLKAKAETRLLERQNQVKNIDNALKVLSFEDKYIIECKYFNKLRYSDIIVNYRERFKYYLSEATIKRRLKKAVNKISKKINRVLFMYEGRI